MTTRTFLLWTVFSFATLSWACGSLPHPSYAAQSSSALVPVPDPPPPARMELVPPSPEGRAVWIDGEWIYRRGRWDWLLGRWVIPKPRSKFSPWVMVRASDGSFLHAPGVWKDERGVTIDSPIPLAYATTEAGPIVDAEGVTDVTGKTFRSIPAYDDGGAFESRRGDAGADPGSESGDP
jgi:hypothetical protein